MYRFKVIDNCGNQLTNKATTLEEALKVALYDLGHVIISETLMNVHFKDGDEDSIMDNLKHLRSILCVLGDPTDYDMVQYGIILKDWGYSIIRTRDEIII